MDSNNPMDIYSLLLRMTPEERQAMFTPYAQQSSILDDQIAQAQALRNSPVAQRSTGIGAALSGLGGAVNKVSGALQEKDLRSKQQVLLKQMQDDAYRRVFGGTQPTDPATAGMGDFVLPPGMG